MEGSIRRRGKNSWEITVEMGTDSTGKRLRKFLSVKGTKAEAERQKRQLLVSIDNNSPVPKGKITVAEWLERWMRDYVLVKNRPRTADRYESDIRLHIVPSIGHIPLSKLSPEHVEVMESRLQAGGKSARSVLHIHAVLRRAINMATRKGYVYQNVVRALDPPSFNDVEVQPPDANEVKKLLSLAKQRTPYYAVFFFMAYTGCRRGEALGLRWKDINLKNAKASIVQSLQRLKGRGLEFQPPKSTESRRAISLDPDTINMLRGLKGDQLLRRDVEFPEVYQDQGLVFPGPLGGPLDPSVLTRSFKKLGRELGLPHIRLHDLRHFHATMLLEIGQHPKVVQERLGHSSFHITMRFYSHVSDGLQEQAARDFASAMASDEPPPLSNETAKL